MTGVHPLLAAFDLRPGSVIALAGGGGKTSLMYALARAFAGAGHRVVTTTTTRIYPPRDDESPALVLLHGLAEPLDALGRRLAETGHVTVALRRRADGKLAGVPAGLVDEWAARKVAAVLIVEADGSAGRPLKAAREGEPVFPASSTDCVLVAGIEAVGAPLGDTHVFRSALASEITGLAPGAPVTPAAVVELLIGARGLAARVPAKSRLLVFLNKVEDARQRRTAYALARLLVARGGRRLARVVVGSLRASPPRFRVFER